MSGIDLLLNYFPDLGERQKEQYAAMEGLYSEWNEKINVISRKDMENFYEHHVLHSLAIAKVQPFKPMAEILDVGTGGGFPGVPLAVMFPDTKFTLVDSVGKKIKVVSGVVEQLGLQNCTVLQARAESLTGEYDFVVSRAVTALPEFYGWVKKKVSRSNYHELHNGILYLKGGDLRKELAPFGKRPRTWEVHDFYPLPWFEEKRVVYLSV